MYKLITPPPFEPLDLATVKNFLRVDPDITNDDALINSFIATARIACEARTKRKFVSQVWEKWMDDWPVRIYQPKIFIDPSLGLGGAGYGYPVTTWPKPQDYIELLPAVTSVNYIQYYMEDYTMYVMDPSLYEVDLINESYCRVVLAPDASWPTDTPDALLSANAVRVNFNVGYPTYQGIVNVSSISQGATLFGVPALAVGTVAFNVSVNGAAPVPVTLTAPAADTTWPTVVADIQAALVTASLTGVTCSFVEVDATQVNGFLMFISSALITVTPGATHDASAALGLGLPNGGKETSALLLQSGDSFNAAWMFGKTVMANHVSYMIDTVINESLLTLQTVLGNARGVSFQADDIPDVIKQAMLLLIGHWYVNREPITMERGIPQQLPFTVDALLASETVMAI